MELRGAPGAPLPAASPSGPRRGPAGCHEMPRRKGLTSEGSCWLFATPPKPIPAWARWLSTSQDEALRHGKLPARRAGCHRTRHLRGTWRWGQPGRRLLWPRDRLGCLQGHQRHLDLKKWTLQILDPPLQSPKVEINLKSTPWSPQVWHGRRRAAQRQPLAGCFSGRAGRRPR